MRRRVVQGGGGVKPNRLDRWLLQGDDPEQPCTKLAMLRLRGVIVLSLFIALLGVGLMLWLYQRQTQVREEFAQAQRIQLTQACNQANAQRERTRKLLLELANDETSENDRAEAIVRNLAATVQDLELRRVLVALSMLETTRDKDVARLFKNLAKNTRQVDCEAETQ